MTFDFSNLAINLPSDDSNCLNLLVEINYLSLITQHKSVKTLVIDNLTVNRCKYLGLVYIHNEIKNTVIKNLIAEAGIRLANPYEAYNGFRKQPIYLENVVISGYIQGTQSVSDILGLHKTCNKIVIGTLDISGLDFERLRQRNNTESWIQSNSVCIICEKDNIS